MEPRQQSGREPWIKRLHRLLPYRVREILLVSSPYDAFILEEDGPLSERLFTEYSELSLSWFPRVLHAASSQEAETLLRERRFDLVLTTSRLGDTDAVTLARRVKAIDPTMPVVLLTFSEADLKKLPGGRADPRLVDHVFLWSGDVRILITVNKLVEDARNTEHDTRVAGVPVIIVVEDSVRYYSAFLTLLYSELVKQAQSLIAEGVNNLHKSLRLRTRPKVLLASTFEDAMEHYRRYSSHVLAVMTDVRFAREGVEDADAGFYLAAAIRRLRPDLPILLQSAEPENAQRALELRTHYVDKHSATLYREIQRFVAENLGFGDFIFRLPDGTELARARDVFEMEQVLRNASWESLEYHASRNHFSIWLKARGMYHLAHMVRPRSVADFDDVEELRRFLLDVVRKALAQEQQGVISDFSSRAAQQQQHSHVVRLGMGSIGGKARGIAFAASTLGRYDEFEGIADLDIKVPKTIIVGTEEFDRFMELNGLAEEMSWLDDDREIVRTFLNGYLPSDLMRDLETVCSTVSGPVAVRSSSLLEDLQFQPFSGIYATYMLPNNHPDPGVRFEEICRAIKAVYASTFCQNARSYIQSTPFLPEEEKMAVVIQEIVGQRHGDRFYPHFSGIALSHNYYPVGPQRAEEGVALVALGLGHMVVAGGNVLRFSPRQPAIQPQYTKAEDYLCHGQRQFYALDMSRPLVDFEAGCAESSLRLYDLDAAEQDGTLPIAGSVYDPDDDLIRDDLKRSGPRVITFNNVLKWNAVPVAPALDSLLEILSAGMGCAVEIEYAVDMGDWGRASSPSAKRRPPCLHVLQIRPLVTYFLQGDLDPHSFDPDVVLCRTDKSLGHGVITDIHDLVYVKHTRLDSFKTPAIAGEVGEIDATLRAERAPYLLIGPGRWGTSDPRLGIPVQWTQIAGARVIAETNLNGRAVEPSQGTHFFQNITSLGVGYLTVEHTSRGAGRETGFVDRDWLDAQPALRETAAVRHVRFEEPVRVYLDGQRNMATVIKPGATPDGEINGSE